MTKKQNALYIKYSCIPFVLFLGSITFSAIFKIEELKYIAVPSGFLFFVMFYMLGVFSLYVTRYKQWYDQYDGLIIGWGVKNPFILMEYFIISDLDEDKEGSD